MKIYGVIPARYASTRLPGKSLLKILDKPLLQWVIEGVKTSKKLDEIIVATDHKEIFNLSESLGVKAVMTESDLPSGSDRIWAAIKDEDVDLVLNIQGDEPLVSNLMIDTLAETLINNSNAEMGTLASRINYEEFKNTNVVKVIVNQNNEAIYFSRLGIPFSRKEFDEKNSICYKHIGMYAYKKSFLKKFCESAPTELELSESLEQLRALYMGAKIQVGYSDQISLGVDVKEDILKVENVLKEVQNGN